MHASACEALLPHLSPTSRVLDIGSGSGYLTHVLANLVAPTGTVIGIDHIPELVELARDNMRKSREGRELLDGGRVKFVAGDGRRGWEEGAPYDAIHVGAGAARVHEELVQQLGKGGRMFIPVDDDDDDNGGWASGEQSIWVVDKHQDGEVTKERREGVRYVPLTNAPRGKR